MNYRISESEYEVMDIIWGKNDWITINEVHSKLSETKTRAYRTVGTFIIRLQEKGILESKKQGISNVYKALVTKDEYIREQTRTFLEQIHKGNKKSLIAALYDENVSNEAIDKLLKTLEG